VSSVDVERSSDPDRIVLYTRLACWQLTGGLGETSRGRALRQRPAPSLFSSTFGSARSSVTS
jgi:hypothetical protein